MKRQSLLLSGWLLLTTLPSVHAQFSHYTITNTITIGAYTGTNDDVVIPSTIDGLPVGNIAPFAFSRSSITSVTIPNSVTSIGWGAFRFCTNLTSIILPNSVTSIADSLFFGCSSLTSITVPNSVTGIEEQAFWDCYSLTNVTIPNSVTSIGNYAFNYCTGLTSVLLPSSVTSISAVAFLYCTNLTAINVETNNPAYSSVSGVLFDKSQTTLIGYPCGKVGSYSIPNSVTSIGDSAFNYCFGLTNVTIPNSVTSIGNSAFNYCTSLTNVTIPNSVTSIGNYAFNYCTSLTNVTIPNSVTSIGNYAFNYCTNLTAMNVETNNPAYSSVSGVLFDKSQTTLIGYPGGKVGSYSIPNSVTSIGNGAFGYCTSLTSVIIPNSINSLGDSAFFGCSSLASVYFQGNAPSTSWGVFGDSDGFPIDNATAYHLPGTTGWQLTYYYGIPLTLWSLPYPLVLNGGLGVQSKQFSFTVSWPTNLSVVVEATTDLGTPVWSPLATNALSGGIFYFNDPQWTNYPSRFYRIRSP